MTARVIPLPAQRYAPSAKAVVDVLQTLEDPDAGDFLALALAALRGVESHRGKPTDPARVRHVVDGIAIAFVALGAALGVGDEALELALAESPIPSDPTP